MHIDALSELARLTQREEVASTDTRIVGSGAGRQIRPRHTRGRHTNPDVDHPDRGNASVVDRTHTHSPAMLVLHAFSPGANVPSKSMRL